MSITTMTPAYGNIAYEIVALLVPCGMSIKTLRSSKAEMLKEGGDTIITHHLFYWLLFLVTRVIGLGLSEGFFSGVPFFYEIRLLVVFWLYYPPFNGAGYVYFQFLKRPIMQGVSALEEMYAEKLSASVRGKINDVFETIDEQIGARIRTILGSELPSGGNQSSRGQRKKSKGSSPSNRNTGSTVSPTSSQ